MRIKHVGEDVYRGDKLIWLMRHPEAAPLVRRHLRVCWEDPQPGMNCGHCEKCVRTRVVLHRKMPEEQLETMPMDMPLAEAVAGIASLPSPLYSKIWTHYAEGCSTVVKRAIEALVARSPHP